MRKKNRMGLNIGTSSILLVFVLLCMVTFAALSYVSANGDYKLSRSLADRTTAYYAADSKAEETTALLYERLSRLAQSAADTDAYLEGIPGILEGMDTEILFSPMDEASLESHQGETGNSSESGESSLGSLSWQVPLNDTQILQITLELLDPLTSEALFAVSQWQVLQSQSWEDTSSLNLYDGS